MRGDWVRNPNPPADERTIDRWFDTAFVVPSAPGAIGNAGRNLIIGLGRKNVDVMVARNFRLPVEGYQIQFRFESFNFTNRANFGPPARGIGGSTAGRVNDADDPRPDSVWVQVCSEPRSKLVCVVLRHSDQRTAPHIPV